VKKIISGILFFLLFFLISCTIKNLDIDYTNVTIHKKTPVRRGNPNYIIYPLTFPTNAPSAFIVPFRIITTIQENRGFLEIELTKILYHNWLKNLVFPKFIMSNIRVKKLDQALSLARKAKCDLLIYPTITYCFFGGNTGKTYIAIKIDIYETLKKRLMWSIIHAGEITYQDERDYIFWRTKQDMPIDPEAVIINTLAQDIYPPIKRWAEKKSPIFIEKKKKRSKKGE